ncbi:hypothetical protein CB0940_03625 [Cercospora beticola]|uniref:Uncharacterized protein n=1 Tax=Cercospora beticola TaxID=122368 RepID=A0A2G5I4M4_CERBT|nr:hypothetical protein CB0940_03625 [Cercospora beticola]PIA99759.1 hypothetical protein CB0940_03625 [Cercospora beticola]
MHHRSSARSQASSEKAQTLSTQMLNETAEAKLPELRESLQLPLTAHNRLLTMPGAPNHAKSARSFSPHDEPPPAVGRMVQPSHGHPDPTDMESRSPAGDHSATPPTTLPATLDAVNTQQQQSMGAGHAQDTTVFVPYSNPAAGEGNSVRNAGVWRLHSPPDNLQNASADHDNDRDGASSEPSATAVHNGVPPPTSIPATTSASLPSSAPYATVLPKNVHDVTEDFNGYGSLSAEDILYDTDASGNHTVPEDHIYGGIFLKVLAEYDLSEITEAINMKKVAVGKRKIQKNSITKRKSAALAAKAAADAARDGTQLNVYDALVASDVAAGKSLEVAQASRKQKSTENRNGTYGTGKRPVSSSGAWSRPKRKQPTQDTPDDQEEEDVGMPAKKRVKRTRLATNEPATQILPTGDSDVLRFELGYGVPVNPASMSDTFTEIFNSSAMVSVAQGTTPFDIEQDEEESPDLRIDPIAQELASSDFESLDGLPSFIPSSEDFAFQPGETEAWLWVPSVWGNPYAALY